MFVLLETNYAYKSIMLFDAFFMFKKVNRNFSLNVLVSKNLKKQVFSSSMVFKHYFYTILKKQIK